MLGGQSGATVLGNALNGIQRGFKDGTAGWIGGRGR